MKKIIVTCKGADNLSIDKLENFQGGLKNLSKENLIRIKKQIIRNGFNVPFFIWKDGNKNKIIDGHQRLKGLKSLSIEGYEIPLLPVAYIEAENEKDARQKLLGIASQYGEFEIEELGNWIDDLGEELADSLRFSDSELEIIDIQKKDIKNIEKNMRNENLKSYKKVHVLLSMNQEIFFQIKNDLIKLKKIDGVEYEQSQN